MKKTWETFELGLRVKMNQRLKRKEKSVVVGMAESSTRIQTLKRTLSSIRQQQP